MSFRPLGGISGLAELDDPRFFAAFLPEKTGCQIQAIYHTRPDP